MRRDSGREDGFALVLVLWSLLLLSAIAVSLLTEVHGARTVAATDVARLQARLAADGTINRVILSLLDLRDPLRLPLDGSSHIVADVGRDVAVRVEGEVGKIDLNAAPPSLLAALFRSRGVTLDEAQTLAERVVAWRTLVLDTAGATAAAPYREAARAYGPRLAPFRSVGELRLVLGMNDTLQAAVAPSVTVWSGDATVDRGIASSGVLLALEEAGDTFAASQRAARDNGTAAGATRPAAPGEAVTIVARVEGPALVLERRAVIQIAGDRREPYRVLAWQ